MTKKAAKETALGATERVTALDVVLPGGLGTGLGTALESVPTGGHDELNVARLSLISAQSRVPASYTSWTRTYQAGETTVTVTCTALTGHVVPHGLDNDVMVAIINLYLEDGCPEDGTIRVTMHRLLQAAGLSGSAHYYREVRQCLRRLQSTSYQIVQGWWVQGRQRHVDATFNYLWKVTATREDDDDIRSALEIRLPDEVARSIRDGYVKPLDLGVYRDLSSPPVRAVYRVLDALRWDSGSAQDRVTVNLLEWGERLSIYSAEPDKIRRVLQPAHDELTQRGILIGVEIEGRGKAQQLTYVFAPAARLPDPELLQELTRRGMYPAVAGKYLHDHPDPAPVQRALRQFDAYPGRKQNAGALLRDMLIHPERYDDPASLPASPPVSKPDRTRPLAQPQPALLEQEVEAAQMAELLSLTPARQLSRLEHQLTFMQVTPHLSVADRERLKRAVLGRQVAVVDLLQVLLRNLAQSPEERASLIRATLPE
ncbi:replication initiator protein A [Deinococcus sp. QL22]|uniref:replication initiator protein A n=1 Tax=Deinococcus sp. QL22 TaxID=2939437 RepID=UPI002018075C|nr:replication initiator protein A [Deinococcus sp. QL22]UQN08866.1 replication initiator protein A [Deinococcus sp. QL22]